MLTGAKQFNFSFSKFDATGNDFICIDNRQNAFANFGPEVWAKLCHRRHGVGADGVLLLSASSKATFRMSIINADGTEAEMCGNGLRAVSGYARQLGIELENNSFYMIETMNSIYKAELIDGMWRIEMSEDRDWNSIKVDDLFAKASQAFYLNTGVPHTLFQVSDLSKIDVDREGLKISSNKRFENGSNINFFQELGKNMLQLRTFERGVDGETYSCGTGVAACAWSYARSKNDFSPLLITTKGGQFRVEWKNQKLYLIAGVTNTFCGTTQLEIE